MQNHLVRFGALGHIGQFVALDAMVFRRGTRVICRSERGAEMGTVLTVVRGPASLPRQAGTILRKVTTEDDLLWARIEKHRDRAFRDCQRLLERHRAEAALMDVEVLFDGQSIYFYFLGPITRQIERLTAELAEVYEARVQLRHFIQAITQGCGPGCGTDEAAGCGDACVSCAVAGSCTAITTEPND